MHCTNNEHTYIINEIINSLLNAIVVKFRMVFLVRDMGFAYIYSDIFVAIYSYDENKKKISIFS